MSRIGETKSNNFGSEMVIVGYRNNKDIDVYFPQYDWTFYHNTYRCFQQGKIKCPYESRVYHTGYLGEGRHKGSENGKETKVYSVWKGILQRCYDEKSLKKYPTYKDCEVCEEWHNFQNFAKWYEKNYYEIDGERMCVDKDILCKGNKVYSPTTCVFVPNRINGLFVKCNSKRGNYPVGVCKGRSGYETYCSDGVKRRNLGIYNTPYEAFSVYKEFKEKLIKQVADEYKGLIPIELYDAMYQYEIDIDD